MCLSHQYGLRSSVIDLAVVEAKVPSLSVSNTSLHPFCAHLHTYILRIHFCIYVNLANIWNSVQQNHPCDTLSNFPELAKEK